MKKILFYIAIIFLFIACKSPATEEPETVPANDSSVTLDEVQKQNAGIVTALPEVRTIQSTLNLNGTIEVPPQNLISVSFPLGGYLKNTPLLPGFHVSKGQVIATMEDQSYVQLQQDYLTAKAKMEYLEADFKRQKELSEAEAASKKNFQMVSSEFKTQQVLLKALEEKLKIIGIVPEKLTIEKISRSVPVRSPIDGFVTKVNVNIGKYVNPADVMFELVNPTDIHAAFTIFEKDISLIKKGTKGIVSLIDKPGETYNVETILVTKNISSDRTGIIHCHFENQKTDLLPGMFITGTFFLNNTNATVINESAILHYAGANYLFTTEDEKTFTLTPVNLGVKDSGFIEIKSDTQNNLLNKKTVVKGAFALLGKLKNKSEE